MSEIDPSGRPDTPEGAQLPHGRPTASPGGGQQRLSIVPTTLRAANAYVTEHHRHHRGNAKHKFSVAVEDERGTLRGVAIAARPKARMLDNGRRLEVVRVATDGCPNACSALYGAVARAGVEMGYKRHDIFTFILDTEEGTSLKAAGWVLVAETDGGTWSRPSRPRLDEDHPLNKKQRWHAAPPPTDALKVYDEAAA